MLICLKLQYLFLSTAGSEPIACISHWADSCIMLSWGSGGSLIPLSHSFNKSFTHSVASSLLTQVSVTPLLLSCNFAISFVPFLNSSKRLPSLFWRQSMLSYRKLTVCFPPVVRYSPPVSGVFHPIRLAESLTEHSQPCSFANC